MQDSPALLASAKLDMNKTKKLTAHNQVQHGPVAVHSDAGNGRGRSHYVNNCPGKVTQPHSIKGQARAGSNSCTK